MDYRIWIRFHLYLTIGVLCVSAQYDHDHEHQPEPPHYKYSRQANEQMDDQVDSHGHQHGHTHEHGSHSHDHHGHSHDGDDHGHGHSHEHNQNVQKDQTSARQQVPKNSFDSFDPDGIFACLNDLKTRRWVYSIGSTLLISIAPFIILSFIPVQANTAESEPMLKVLLSFGSGGLLGDAFLHLIPHAQSAHPTTAHSHSHSHGSGGGHSHGSHDMSIGGYVLAGIITFLMVEKLVRILRSQHIMDSHSHSHSHSQISHNAKKTDKKSRKSKKKEKRSDISSADESDQSCDSEKRQLLEKKSESEVGFRVAAYLNMVADFTHNFTDGLAIGASYLAGINVGLVTMVTILVHEIPHEIGDFAILVQSGFTKKRAMLVQLLTAVGAMSGCILSLSTAGDLADAAEGSWILPFSAGGFIYIATVSVIPELLENSSTWQSIKEVFALLFGIFLMYLIALFE